MRVYLLFAENEHEALLPIISRLKEAGYEPVHPGTVLVGQSIVGEAQQVRASGIPIILFATAKTMGSEWTAKLVNAANSSGENRILVLKVDRDALVSHLTFGERIADYSLHPKEALDYILTALQERYGTPPVTTAVDDHHAASLDEEVGYLDTSMESADIDSRAIEDFRGLLREELEDLRNPTLSSTEFMSRLLLLRKGNPTKAAALLFAHSPQSVVPSALVQCVQYFGVSKESDQDSVLLSGTIQKQLEASFRFVASRIGKRDRPTPNEPRAVSRFDYPMVCVREILANAVVHRDYSDRARKVHVRLYSNRLEISSPGSWATVKSTETEHPGLGGLVGESVSRNPSLAHAMSLARYLESEGSGIPKAINDASQSGAAEPSVRFVDGFTTVTIWPNKLDLASIERLVASTRSDLRHRGFDWGGDVPLDILIDTRVSEQSDRGAGSRLRSAQDIVSLDTQCIVVTGGAGSGKTTFLKQVGRLLAKEASHIPIFVPLRSLRVSSSFLNEFLDGLEENWNRDLDLGVAPGFADALLASRNITFLLDGLDEVGDPAHRQRILDLVEALTQKYRGTRVIMSTRTVGMPDLASPTGMRLVLNVEPWSHSDLYEFAQKFFERAGEPNVGDKAGGFIKAIGPGLQSLAGNPMLATLLLGGFSQSGVVAASVYELARMTISSLGQWDRQRGISSSPPPHPHAQKVLRHLALTSLEQGVSWNRMPEPWIEDTLRGLQVDKGSGADALSLFEALVKRQNIVQNAEASTSDTPTYSFTHIVFAELLAAQELARRADNGAYLVRSLLPFKENHEFLQISYFASEEWARTRHDGDEDLFNALLLATQLEHTGDDRLAAAEIVKHLADALWVLKPPKPGWRQELTRWVRDAEKAHDPRMRSTLYKVTQTLNAVAPAEHGVDRPPEHA
ncbi:ATP-binding protein [Arthrobacter bambusae]|uniref:ATP-binding protein n=1 Tax=Arthrobacter bambusae TaxID=1338426 RepID=UPI00278076B2|nr:ATP-binding protein [Arthrobacter bambusae]MDQ0030908.1 hypothetical protein [Arthrobacter bambusae]MDQ0099273.1 hypothetical protein [Arthrobacter bambusae]